MLRRFWTRLRWLFAGSQPAEVYHLTTKQSLVAPLIDASAVVTRTAPAHSGTQYRVVLECSGAETALYQGPVGAHARQVYEYTQPHAGETMRFFDGSDCRGCKSG